MFARKSWLAVLATTVLLLAAAASVPAEKAKSPVLRAGLDFRSVSTHFSDYSSYYYTNFGYYTINTWETFQLLGVRADMLWRKRLKDQLCLEYGFGLGFYVGGYNYEVGMYTGSGRVSFCSEIDVPLRLSYWLSEKLTAFGRLGTSLLFINAANPKDPPPGRWGLWFYDDAFLEGLPDVYLGLGVDYKFTPAWILSFMLRFTMFGLGAWTDYGQDPVDEGFQNIGVSTRLVYEFGR